MKVRFDNHTWNINIETYGGILKDMYEDGFDDIDLCTISKSSAVIISPELLDYIFTTQDTSHEIQQFSNNMLINCFNLVHFLNIEPKMNEYGTIIAQRMIVATKPEVLAMMMMLRE